MINGRYTERRQSHECLNTAMKSLRIYGIRNLASTCEKFDLF